ncbi:MAG: aspartate carbamoyltransferase catalytic subunit [Parcubacteria group bacterium Licking1014_1]|nr:MAG: aspartate carbamoyltransferase catalytic subunit [Parcubacteria group bacterium Licking1014_1]
MDAKFDGWPHIIDTRQFSRELLENNLFPLARRMEKIFKHGGNNDLRDKIAFMLFFEASTRTRFSFESAMLFLGGKVLQTENAKEFSSAIKGESLADTIRVLCRYKPNVIILRHHEEGSAELAAKVSSAPIINAGDGRGQHPTQALLDIYTIQKKLGHIDGISIAMVGDLMNGRTVRSLCYLLGKFDRIIIYFVSPACAKMKDDIKEYLSRHRVCFGDRNNLREVAEKVDVIYQTRTQKERGTFFDRNDHSLGYFVVDSEILSLMKKDAIIMHPLPRVDEITPEIDDDPRAIYLTDQVDSGLFIRMALLKMILNSDA